MTDEHREQTAIFALKLSYRLMRLASIHESQGKYVTLGHAAGRESLLSENSC